MGGEGEGGLRLVGSRGRGIVLGWVALRWDWIGMEWRCIWVVDCVVGCIRFVV